MTIDCESFLYRLPYELPRHLDVYDVCPLLLGELAFGLRDLELHECEHWWDSSGRTVGNTEVHEQVLERSGLTLPTGVSKGWDIRVRPKPCHRVVSAVTRGHTKGLHPTCRDTYTASAARSKAITQSNLRNASVSLSLASWILSSAPSDGPDKVRLALEACSASWFRLVKYSGYAVAIGCAMEAPETFSAMKRWWMLRFRGVDKEETIEEKRSIFVPVAAIGLLVIVLGIVVETYSEARVSGVDALERQHESDKITAAEGEAVSAILDAGSAASSAQRAQWSADAATADATKAQGSANAAGKKAAAAQETVNVVGKRAEDIEQELSSAQYLLEPRKVLSPTGLKMQLAPFKGQTIYFRSYFNDSDGYFLCRELVDVAGAAGVLAVDGCNTVPVKFPIAMGVNVFAPDEKTMLALNGIMAGVTPFGSGGDSHVPNIVVFVGRKNTFHVGETAQTRDAAKTAAAMGQTQRRTSQSLQK